MNLLNKILQDMVQSSTPILLCVLGGVYAYKANVLNIAMEGMMLIAAFVSCFVTIMTESYAVGMLTGVVASLLFGIIFSVLGVKFKGNVIIIGLGLNMLAASITLFLLKLLEKSELVANVFSLEKVRLNFEFLAGIPVLGAILSRQTYLTWFAYILIALMAFLMYRTPLGLHIRVVGESEDAADAIGLKSDALKSIAIMIGALTCGLAGSSLAMEELGGIFTPNMTTGRGFIAIAAIYCGQGNPVISALYAIVFGLARSLALNLSVSAGPMARLFNTFPYLAICVILAVSSWMKYRNVKSRG